ncbi:MAG: response regulator [Thermodesulfobacteria bacterium]|nr:response regulator [Thermodesulfobacteriota bacterium]
MLNKQEMYQNVPKKDTSPVSFLRVVNRLFSSYYHLPLDYFLEQLVQNLGLVKAAVYYNRLDYRWQLVASLVAQHLASQKTSPFPEIIEYQEIWPGLETKLSEGEKVLLTKAEIEALGFVTETDHHFFVFPLLEDKWWNGIFIVDFGLQAPSAEDLALLEELVNALSLAIKRQKRESEYLDVTRVFQELLNNIPYVVILVDSSGRWLLTNKKTAELFGFKRRIYQGQTFEQLSELRPQFRSLFERLKELSSKLHVRETPARETFKLKVKGQPQWWEFLLIPFRCDSERRVLILGKDVTSFKLAQERLLTILENLPAMVYIVHPESRKILYGNTLFKKYFGGEVVQKGPCHQVLFSREKPCDFCHLTSPSPELRQEKEFYDPQRRRWLKIYETFIPWLDKDLVRLGMIQDITDFKRQEEELIRSQKMEILGKMTGNIAHEFNNVLAVISGYLDLFKARAKDDEKLTKYIQQIQQAIDAGTKLIKQLLILSRGKTDDKEQISDLKRIITEQQELIRKLLGETIELEVNLCAEPLPIRLSYEEIQHLLTNLVLNARDAMPQGGIVRITTKAVETSRGRAALLRIEDTGHGISKEELAHIFEPFYSTKAFGEGTGLGLNVVLTLVKRCGGEIKVESEPGRGTIFEIILPLQNKMIVTGEKDLVPPSETKVSEVSKKRILIAEDEPHIREMLAEMLEGQDFEVAVAENGLEALEWLKKNDFQVDLIITDVVMPKMDGVQLYRELQKLAPEIPVIFISGYAEHILEKYGFEEASFKIIKKPFTFRQLLEEIEKVFG